MAFLAWQSTCQLTAERLFGVHKLAESAVYLIREFFVLGRYRSLFQVSENQMIIGQRCEDKESSLRGYEGAMKQVRRQVGCYFTDRGGILCITVTVCVEHRPVWSFRGAKILTGALDFPGSSSFQMGREGRHRRGGKAGVFRVARVGYFEVGKIPIQGIDNNLRNEIFSRPALV